MTCGLRGGVGYSWLFWVIVWGQIGCGFIGLIGYTAYMVWTS